MTKQGLIRYEAILMVALLILAVTLGLLPLGAAVIILLALWDVLSDWKLAGPAYHRMSWYRRRRAHARSQEYLSRFDTAIDWPDSGNRVSPHSKQNTMQFSAGRTVHRPTGVQIGLKRTNTCFHARDQPAISARFRA